MEPEIVAWSLMRFRRTTRVIADQWTVLDNCWPLNRPVVSKAIKDVCRLTQSLSTSHLEVPNNVGGHQGVTLCLSINPPGEEDYVLVYDPDSNPVSEGWLEAMIEVLNTDKTIGYISLLDTRNTDRKWSYESIAGNRVGFLTHPEMWNVTLFRSCVLKEGMKSDGDKFGSTYYGHVEVAMQRHVKELGMRNGYLIDFREEKCPIDHPRCYTKWKSEHAFGKYPGNFDLYCKENNIK